jgi:hypothetical protein
MLYARSTANHFGTVEGPEDVMELLRGREVVHKTSVSLDDVSSPPPDPTPSKGVGRSNTASSTSTLAQYGHRIKPAVYTYIISAEDDSFRFSETGAAFFVDFASKHALHSNCATSVRYSGEFHPRPLGGWDHFSDETPDEEVEWEFVIDNNSGTYSPDKELLPVLKGLFEYNFPGVGIWAMDHEDPELKKSTEACREYALKHRGVKKEHLQPHIGEGEVTLSHHASKTAQQDDEPQTESPTHEKKGSADVVLKAE